MAENACYEWRELLRAPAFALRASLLHMCTSVPPCWNKTSSIADLMKWIPRPCSASRFSTARGSEMVRGSNPCPWSEAASKRIPEARRERFDTVSGRHGGHPDLQHDCSKGPRDDVFTWPLAKPASYG